MKKSLTDRSDLISSWSRENSNDKQETNPNQ